jgi:hypothetical protein
MYFKTNGEPERAARLLDVLCFIGKKQDDLLINVFTDIVSMEDHKGTLIIDWVKEPSQRAKFWCNEAWSAQNESFDAVYHYFPGHTH